MTLVDIIKKLIKNNKWRYFLYGASICFAVTMIGAYGALLFSDTITGVLMTDGSTYLISLGMYAITIIGILTFLFYANEIYLQSSRKEAGIYLSLGLKPKAVVEIESRQFDLCFLLGGLTGMALTIPVSWGSWKLLSLFLTYTSRNYSVGWKGLEITLLLLVLSWLLLRVKNRVQLTHMDVLSVLKLDTVSENVKGSNPILGIIGLMAIPIGIIFFNITAVKDSMKTVSTVFLGISLVGVYLVTAQITSVGRIMKRVFPTHYIKNLLFYNLVRQKGRQYTLALFVSTVLIALTVFSETDELSEKQIKEAAHKHGIEVTDWHTLQLLLLGREFQYKNGTKEWSSEFVVSVSEFNALSGKNLTVLDDEYAYFQDSNDSMFLTCTGENGTFYNPVTKVNFSLHKHQLLTDANVLNDSAQIDSLLIVSDKTFQAIAEKMQTEYHFIYYLFRGTGLSHSAALQRELLEKQVEAHDGKMIMNIDQLAVKEKLTNYRVDCLNYEGNEMEAARSWLFYPYAKQTQGSIQMEYGAIYLLLVFFIALISFVSATMIITLKVSGTIRQDTENYRKAMYLGQCEKDLQHLIRKQIKLVFFFPTICGSITAGFMINRFLSVSSVTHFHEVTMVAIGLSLIVLALQLFIFSFVQKKLICSVANTVYC